MRKIIMLICALSFVVATYAKPFSMADYLKAKGEGAAKPEKVEVKVVDYDRGVSINLNKVSDAKRKAQILSGDVRRQKYIVKKATSDLSKAHKYHVMIKSRDSIGSNKYLLIANSLLKVAVYDHKKASSKLNKLEGKQRRLNRSITDSEKKIAIYRSKILERDGKKIDPV